jgi:hypothetical protein
MYDSYRYLHYSAKISFETFAKIRILIQSNLKTLLYKNFNFRTLAGLGSKSHVQLIMEMKL